MDKNKIILALQTLGKFAEVDLKKILDLTKRTKSILSGLNFSGIEHNVNKIKALKNKPSSPWNIKRRHFSDLVN